MGVVAATLLAVGPAAWSEEAVEPLDEEPPEADPSAEPAVPRVEALARDAFARGERLFADERYAEAAAAFEQAYDLLPSPTVHFNVARALELSGRRALARARYQAFLDSGVGSPERRRLALERIASLGEEVARLVVSTYPPGGLVLVDGRVEGREPVSVTVRPGRHLVEVRLRGVGSRRAVEVGAGERRHIAFALHSADAGGAGDEAIEARPRRTLHPAWFCVAVGLSIASAVSATLLHASALSTHLSDHESPSEDAFGSSRAPMLATSGDVLLGFALALPAAALVLGFFTDWAGAAPASRAPGRAPAAGSALSF